MEYFDIEIALSSNGIDTICNRDYLPNLTRGCFWMIADQQKRSSMEKVGFVYFFFIYLHTLAPSTF